MPSPSPTPSCEKCGAELSDAQGICQNCDRELTYPNGDPLAGRYLCPRCQARFDTPVASFYPPDRPWYLPQVPACQCPHCATYLRDRKSLPLFSFKEQIFLIGTLVFSGLIRHPQVNTFRIVLLIVLLAVAYRRYRRGPATITDDQRYLPFDTAPPR